MRKFALVVVAFLVLLLGACGGGAVVDGPFVWEWDMEAEDPFYGETLTIASVWLDASMRGAVSAFRRDNPGVNVEFVSYRDDIDAGRTSVAMQFMAGNAPTLIIGSGLLVDVSHPNAANLLADWRPIMTAYPRFNPDDWFMDAFDTFTDSDMLLSLPSALFYFHVVANSSVPGLIEAMEGKTSISLDEMIDLHRRFAPDGMYLLNGFDALLAAEFNLEHFLDIDGGMVNFSSPEFVRLLDESRELTSPEQIFGNPINHLYRGNREREAHLAQNYLFSITSNFVYEYLALFDEETIFVGALPFVNRQGHVVANPNMTIAFSLNAAATPAEQALALHFLNTVMFDSAVYGNVTNEAMLHHPTNRNQQRAEAENAKFWDLHRAYTGTSSPWRFANIRGANEFIDALLARYSAIEQMPIADRWPGPWAVQDAIREVLEQFHEGLITAEAAANDLQNRVTLIMLEAQ